MCDHPGAPADDPLVRDTGRPEGHLALDGCGRVAGSHNRPPARSGQLEYATRIAEAQEKNLVVMLHPG